jgi:subtilisin-like proprotein convertase family protein
VTNGAGLHFSTDYGFGLVDTEAMITACKNGDYVALDGEQLSAEDTEVFDRPVLENESKEFNLTLSSENNLSIEWVELTVDLDSYDASDYRIELTSPAGTEIMMIEEGSSTYSIGYGDWMNGGFRFGTPAFVSEKSAGIWKVRVSKMGSGDDDTLHSLKLKVYGYKEGGV